MDARSLQPVLGAVGLGLVAVCTVPSAGQLWSRARQRARSRGHGYDVVPELYQSKDGTATSESVDRFSDRESRVAAWVSLAVGLAASLAAAGLLTAHRDSFVGPHPSAPWLFNVWADVPAWTLVCLQCASIPSRSQYDRRFRLAALGLASAAVILASTTARFGYDMVGAVTQYTGRGERAVGLCWLMEMLAALVALLSFASFPHRPDVYDKGGLVDQQHAVSLLTRFSFSWNQLIFDISKERRLNQADLPNMDGDTRSANVNDWYLAGQPKGRLWWQLVKAFRAPLALQWCLTLVQSVLSLFPQYVLYHFLEGLEIYQDKRASQPELWGWVVGLASSLLLQIWVSSTQRWNTSSRLENPVLSLLQSLIFQKALKLDEVAGAGEKSEKKSKDKDEPPKDKAKDSKDSKDSKKPKSDVRQAVVNHMKMDSSRMNIFCTYNYWFPLALFKLIFAGSFLMQLLGWKAFCSGLGSALFIIPISHLMSRRYGSIQFGLMKYRDAKAHVLTEALHGMRQIKYSALEDLYEKKIMETRNAELSQYWTVTKWMCALSGVVNLGPVLLSCVSLSMYAWTSGGHVKASVIFASLGLFDQLDEAIGNLPIIQVYLMEAWTSCVRIEKYLNQPERAPVSEPGDAITFRNATVRWPRVEDADDAPPAEDETRSILRDVTLDIPMGELTVITGKTGAGKSLLLAAILGEVKLLTGAITTPPPPPISVIETKDIADSEWILPTLTSFVSQTPWIESGTVRDNITFGMPFNETRYNRVLQTCALEKDIELLVDGDQTEVGPKGVTLSGGQRWRVALARALYSRAGILILDDVLSAVDAHVGRTIVDEALTGELAEGRTRILATHHAEMVLPKASYLIKLRNGRLESAEPITPEDIEVSSAVVGESSTAASSSDETAVGTASDEAEADGKKKKPEKVVDEEDRESGRVKMHVYKTYIKASNSWLLWSISLVLLFTGRFLGVARTWSLKELTESFTTEAFMHVQRLFGQAASSQEYHVRTPITLVELAARERSVKFWMSLYVILSLSNVINMLLHQMVFVLIGLRASRKLFKDMTYAVLRAPLRWADTMPTGRILNRFTTDTFTIDRRLSSDLAALMINAFTLCVIIGTSVAVSPYVLVFGVTLLTLYGKIASLYIRAARDVKRINSVAHSPIYDQFSSVLTGLSTIRAFQRTHFYLNRMFGLIDNGAKSTWSLQLLSRWMSFRMGMLGAVFVTVVAVSILLGNIDSSLAGFALVFALRYTGILTRLLTNITSIELGFNAAERVLEYVELKTEPQDGDDAPAAWPSEGKIEVENLTVGYSEELPAVLKDINFDVKAGERIGVVGRTGAGKSTLAAVLFRLLEPRQGFVRIDGIDISKIKLSQLRKRLAIIPQDPFLFSGTLRSNLDLDDSVDDYDLQVVLRRVHLVDPRTGDPQRPSAYPPVEEAVAAVEPSPADAAVAAVENGTITPVPEQGLAPALTETTVSQASTAVEEPSAAAQGESDYANAFTDLSTPISTGGGNLSQGQRQLVCLARALLTRPKIVVLDEATSAVDRGTDGAIQESLRHDFAAGGCSVLVIAHRLSTVADFDRLLVLHEGRVAEFGTPAELLRAGMQMDAARTDGSGSGSGSGSAQGNEGENGKAPVKAADENGKAPVKTAGEDGVGTFWELVQRSAEKDKLLEMILGGEEASEAGGL